MKYYVVTHLILLKIQNKMDIKVDLLQCLQCQKTFDGATTLAYKSEIKNEIISNKELAEELHKPIIRKFTIRKVHSLFTGTILGADRGYMQLINKFNKIFFYVLLIFVVNMDGLFL